MDEHFDDRRDAGLDRSGHRLQIHHGSVRQGACRCLQHAPGGPAQDAGHRLLPTNVRATRCSLAYSRPSNMNPMTCYHRIEAVLWPQGP
jgi:hypothetical protein